MRDEGQKKSKDSPIILLLPLILHPLSFILFSLWVTHFQSGCRQTSDNLPDIKFEYKIVPDPPKTGLATFTLMLADSTGTPINGARISLEGNMSHAGMRPVFSEAREVESGRYESSLEFTMRGDWIILVHLTLPDGRKLQKHIAVNEVRSG
jgi:YtkA-like